MLAGGRPGLLLFIPPFTAARKREPCPAQRAPPASASGSTGNVGEKILKMCKLRFFSEVFHSASVPGDGEKQVTG